MKKLILCIGGALLCFAAGVSATLPAHCRRDADSSACATASLLEAVNAVVSDAPGVVGVAFVSDSDTLLVNNGVRYPMMSVFKLHEALAVADALASRGSGFEERLDVSRAELDADTWSPLLKDSLQETFSISVGELVRYALVSSDNNASNLLFERAVSPTATDRFIRTVAPDTTFAIRFSEAEMKADHDRAYDNWTSPLSAALLIRRVFKDSIPVPSASLEAIRRDLSTVTTGQDRLGNAVADRDGIFFAHKTGSGYRNGRGELVAHNDVGYFRLPDGRDYALAVFVRDFRGTEAEASAVIARISALLLEAQLPS